MTLTRLDHPRPGDPSGPAVDDLSELGEVEIVAGSGALQVRVLEGARV